MRHLSEEKLVGLVVENRDSGDLTRCHLGQCADCRAKYQRLLEVAAFLRESRAVPPVSAWSNLKGRLVSSLRPGRDWTEPRWLPLVLIHLGVVVTGLALIVTLGSWLESSSAWEWVARLPFVSAVGPRGLIGLAFVVGGGLFVLSLTPVICWELGSRSSE